MDINDQNGTVVLEMVVRTPPEIHKEQNKVEREKRERGGGGRQK